MVAICSARRTGSCSGTSAAETVTVTPATGSVSVDSIEEAPLVTRMTKVVFREEDAIMGEHAGQVRVRCFVSTKGRCQRVDFEAAEADFREALRLGRSPEAAYSIYVNRGVVRFRWGKHAEAEPHVLALGLVTLAEPHLLEEGRDGADWL